MYHTVCKAYICAALALDSVFWRFLSEFTPSHLLFICHIVTFTGDISQTSNHFEPQLSPTTHPPLLLLSLQIITQHQRNKETMSPSLKKGNAKGNNSKKSWNLSGSASPSSGTRTSAQAHQKRESACSITAVSIIYNKEETTIGFIWDKEERQKYQKRHCEEYKISNKGRKGSKTLCAIHEDADTLLESLHQPKSPPVLRKLPPEDMGEVLSKVNEQSNHGVDSEVKGAASTLAYSSAYRGGSEEVAGAASTLVYSLAYSGGSTSVRKQNELGGSDDDYLPDKHIDLLGGSDPESNEESDDEESDDNHSGGRDNSDDDDNMILDGIDIDLDDELHSSLRTPATTRLSFPAGPNHRISPIALNLNIQLCSMIIKLSEKHMSTGSTVSM